MPCVSVGRVGSSTYSIAVPVLQTVRRINHNLLGLLAPRHLIIAPETQLEPEALIMIDRRPSEVFEIFLPSPSEFDQLIFVVRFVDGFGKEIDPLGEKPDQAGEESLCPRGRNYVDQRGAFQDLGQ